MPRGPQVPTEAIDNSVRYDEPRSFPCCLHVSQHTPLIDVGVVSLHAGVTSASIEPTGNVDHVCNVRERLDSPHRGPNVLTEQEGPHRWSKPTTGTAKCRNNCRAWHAESQDEPSLLTLARCISLLTDPTHQTNTKPIWPLNLLLGDG